MLKNFICVVALSAASPCIAAEAATAPATQPAATSDTPPATDPTPPGKPPQDFKYVYVAGQGWRLKVFTKEEKSYGTIVTYKTHGELYCCAIHNTEDDAIKSLSHLQDLEVIDSLFVHGSTKGWWRISAIDKNGHGGMMRAIQGATADAAFEHLKKYLSVYQDNGKPRYDLIMKGSQEIDGWDNFGPEQIILDGDPEAPQK